LGPLGDAESGAALPRRFQALIVTPSAATTHRQKARRWHLTRPSGGCGQAPLVGAL